MTKHLAFLGLYVCAAMLAMMGFFTLGPIAETKFFPAYGRFKLISVEPYGAGQSRAIFSFEKKRSCTPAGFAWFNGDIGSSYQIVDFTIDAPGGSGITRPSGHHISSPYIIDVPPNDVRTQPLGEIYSRCHPFWITRSEVYP